MAREALRERGWLDESFEGSGFRHRALSPYRRSIHGCRLNHRHRLWHGEIMVATHGAMRRAARVFAILGLLRHRHGFSARHISAMLKRRRRLVGGENEKREHDGEQKAHEIMLQ